MKMNKLIFTLGFLGACGPIYGMESQVIQAVSENKEELTNKLFEGIKGQVPIDEIQDLIEKGADFYNAVDNWGFSPLMVAVEKDRSDICMLLIRSMLLKPITTDKELSKTELAKIYTLASRHINGEKLSPTDLALLEANFSVLENLKDIKNDLMAPYEIANTKELKDLLNPSTLESRIEEILIG